MYKPIVISTHFLLKLVFIFLCLVYAITAANERESSWSAYYDQQRKTPLADDFSVKWMADSESVSQTSLLHAYQH